MVTDVDLARRRLRLLTVVAIADLALLVPLVVAAVAHRDDTTSVLGPIHGLGFLLELFLAVRGAGEQHWPWWVPGLVLITGGPPGALVAHAVIGRRLRPAPAS